MMTETKKKRRISAIFSLCPAAHTVLLASAALIALHLFTRHNKPFMRALSESVIAPLHQRMASFCALFGAVSVAEVLIAAFALAVLSYIVYELVCLAAKSERIKRLYRMSIRLSATALVVYAGYSMLWGVYYYGDDFIAKSGLDNGEISVEQLETVTVYFAEKLNDYAALATRDQQGFYIADRDEILDKSPDVYLVMEQAFPCLEGPDIRAKGLRFSRILSYMDFTGFFFPFTAEANLNTDFPPGLFASTVAHELAHQRGVAKEQEANFVAVLACLDYGDVDYCYSACMLAYTHLGNALHGVDYDAWYMVYSGLDERVKTVTSPS